MAQAVISGLGMLLPPKENAHLRWPAVGPGIIGDQPDWPSQRVLPIEHKSSRRGFVNLEIEGPRIENSGAQVDPRVIGALTAKHQGAIRQDCVYFPQTHPGVNLAGFDRRVEGDVNTVAGPEGTGQGQVLTIIG